MAITLLLLTPYFVGAFHWVSLCRDRARTVSERAAAEHAAYFARLRLSGERMLSTREAAELVQVSVHTIRAWTRRGILSGRKDERGHNWFREADVLAADLRARRSHARPDSVRTGTIA